MQIKKVLLVLAVILTMTVNIKPAFALDDGAYSIGRSTSYVNPLTGSTEDGGTNITLGESMVSSIVESQLLLEKVNGKMYLTIGLGLSSNVSNVRIKTMNSSGSFSNATTTVTGSSSANGDTVNHYRIQINSLNDYISPILYVNPMGREVQFFIKLNQGSISAGTGVYTSQMVPAASSDSSSTNKSNTSRSGSNATSDQGSSDTTTDQPTTTDTPVATVGEVTRESLFENVIGLSNYVVNSKGKVRKKDTVTAKQLMAKNSVTKDTGSDSSIYLIVGAVVVVAVITAGGFYYVKKIKK